MKEKRKQPSYDPELVERIIGFLVFVYYDVARTVSSYPLQSCKAVRMANKANEFKKQYKKCNCLLFKDLYTLLAYYEKKTRKVESNTVGFTENNGIKEFLDCFKNKLLLCETGSDLTELYVVDYIYHEKSFRFDAVSEDFLDNSTFISNHYKLIRFLCFYLIHNKNNKVNKMLFPHLCRLLGGKEITDNKPLKDFYDNDYGNVDFLICPSNSELGNAFFETFHSFSNLMFGGLDDGDAVFRNKDIFHKSILKPD